MLPLQPAPNEILDQIAETLYHEIMNRNDTPETPLDKVSPNAIEATIAGMTDAIRVNLRERLMKSRYTRNAQSAIHSLPVEVMSEIFLVCTDRLTNADLTDIPGHYKQILTLSAVCSHWNDIVANTPTLWTLLHSQLAPQLIDKALQLSKQFPLTIRCKKPYSGKWVVKQKSRVKRFLHQARSSIHRWKDIGLVMFDIHDMETILDTPAPLLEKLNIAGTDSGNYDEAMTWFGYWTPSLKAITFSAVDYLDWGLAKQSPRLTSMKLSMIGLTLEDAQGFASTLEELKSLKFLRLEDLYSLNDDGPLFRSELPTVYLPHLKTLKIEGTETDVAFGILRMLETPNLEIFSFEEDREEEREEVHPDADNDLLLEDNPLSAWKFPSISAPYDLIVELTEDHVVYHISLDEPKSKRKAPSKMWFTIVLDYKYPWSLAYTAVWFGRSIDLGSIPAPRSTTLSFVEEYDSDDLPAFVEACCRLPNVHHLVLNYVGGDLMDFLLDNVPMPFPELRTIRFEETSSTNEEELERVDQILEMRNGGILGVTPLEEVLLPVVEDDDARLLFNVIDNKYGPGVLREHPVNTFKRDREAMEKLAGMVHGESEEQQIE